MFGDDDNRETSFLFLSFGYCCWIFIKWNTINEKEKKKKTEKIERLLAKRM